MSRTWSVVGAAGWGLVVLWLGSRPSLAPAAGQDKAVHFAMFTLFGILVASMARQRAASLAVVAFAVSSALMLSAGDELLQSFVPGRTSDPLDVVADVCGAATGATLLVLYRARLRRHAESA